MPSREKISWAKLRVGIMAMVGLSILGVLVFLLTTEGGFWSTKTTIYTYMADSAGMERAAPVRLNGILIGKIVRVDLTREQDVTRSVKITMQVDEKALANIPVDSIAAVSAANVLGSKYINIRRGTSVQTVKPGGELPSLDTREFEEVVASGYALLTSLQGILKRVDAIVATVEVGKGSIGKFLVDDEFYNRLVATVQELEAAAAAINKSEGTIGKLLNDDALYDSIVASTRRLEALLDGIEKGEGTAGKLLKDEKLYTEARASITELRMLLADLNAGKGTAGRLLKDEQFYKTLNSLAGNLDSTVQKINTGQGTLGQLLVNPNLYESLNGVSLEMRDLLKDVRANPKKFLRIKLAIF